MFFSVIVTIYNGEACLAQCIDSILRNPAGNYELIIIDDGSLDNTGIICDGYADQYNHVKCVHTKNQGVGNARQAGLEAASGDYIIFVDGDDAWDESFQLSKLEEEIKRNQADMYVFGFIIRRLYLDNNTDDYFKIERATFDDWRKNQPKFLTYFSNGLMFLCWNKIFRRQCIIENGVVSVHHHMEDFRFVLDFLNVSKKVIFLSFEPYIHLKRGIESRSSSARQGMLQGYNLCHNLFLSLFDKEHSTSIHQIMAPTYIGTIYRHLDLIDRHIDEKTAKKVLEDVHKNNLAKQSILLYNTHSFSEKVTFFLMLNGHFQTLRYYRILVRIIKRFVS